MPAIDETTPSKPIVRGFRFVKPNDVNGMNRSHKFFVVSMKTARFDWTYEYIWNVASCKSAFDLNEISPKRFVTEPPHPTDWSINLDNSYISRHKFITIDANQYLFAASFHRFALSDLTTPDRDSQSMWSAYKYIACATLLNVNVKRSVRFRWWILFRAACRRSMHLPKRSTGNRKTNSNRVPDFVVTLDAQTHIYGMSPIEIPTFSAGQLARLFARCIVYCPRQLDKHTESIYEYFFSWVNWTLTPIAPPQNF